MPTEVLEVGHSPTAEPDEVLYWEYWFGDYEYIGVCQASISPSTNFFGQLNVLEQGLSASTRHDNFVWQPNQRTWKYTAVIKNVGGVTATYNLRVVRTW
jgi:hypothetical protein